jgi:hypothetical protein
MDILVSFGRVPLGTDTEPTFSSSEEHRRATPLRPRSRRMILLMLEASNRSTKRQRLRCLRTQQQRNRVCARHRIAGFLATVISRETLTLISLQAWTGLGTGLQHQVLTYVSGSAQTV